MFTGIIQEIGKIKRTAQKGAIKVIIIQCSNMQADLKLGDSIDCDGICLTVTEFSQNTITVEAMSGTIKTTTLCNWYSGYQVNLEKSIKVDSKLDGHIVQGHVDCVATVLHIAQQAGGMIIEINIPNEVETLIVNKGSIAVNGVSLTVASLKNSSFSVSIVTFTWKHTNLSALKPGSKVNLEFDIIGKYINRYLSKIEHELTKEKLLEKGY